MLFVLIVMLFNSGDGKLEFVGARPAETYQSCEKLFESLGTPPQGFRASHRCIAVKDLDTTLVNREQAI